jgi:hypothetical protein|tara:strand:+ start:3247 stop:3564 length:318 start_codon:yes stop_codon:yes gene_type:complete
MHGSDYDDDKSDNGPEEVSPQARGRRISKYMNEISSNVKVYILSFFTTAYMYAPIYTLNTCKWVKMAVVDAPLRFSLDVDLQYMKIQRHLSREKAKENTETVKDT